LYVLGKISAHKKLKSR